MDAIKFWKDRPVLITGATGIVGSHLTQKLVDIGARVYVFIRSNNPQSYLFRTGTIKEVTVINGHLENFSDIERAINTYDINSVFHLGAQTQVGAAHRSPLTTLESNIRGTYNLLEVCRQQRQIVKRIVIASSDKAYGSQVTLPYTEDAPLGGRFPYDASKSCVDILAQSYARTYDLPIAIARCGNIFGPGDSNWNRLIPGTIRAYYHNRSPLIRSNGKYQRDYLYVLDAVHAYSMLAQTLPFEDPYEFLDNIAFNFSLEQPLAALDIVLTIGEMMGCSHIQPTILNNAEGEIVDQYLCSKKARELLQWKPLISFRTGLEITIDYYRGIL